ncbi:NifB/NifX family molybdenum-iron cluster-binding protein [Maridesulfovibrio sp.]|uniref:NifB/NifX family molybdenum-iron cluster-binding protein n=1 Tax=Maridesulfovibrio sp. TaxID=2795000 RepID=UPI002A18DA62|nr:NifB/NifX family molybdenum-iron cluster-binding protein [Maridesulfovibrio sp.]
MKFLKLTGRTVWKITSCPDAAEGSACRAGADRAAVVSKIRGPGREQAAWRDHPSATDKGEINMKVAISCQGKDLNGEVDPRFGRAKGFLICDTENDGFEFVDNIQNLNAAQGAGIQSAQNVAATGAKAVITGHVGPKAFMALDKGKISVHLIESGTVAEALASFKAGKLESASEADKDGHW